MGNRCAIRTDQVQAEVAALVSHDSPRNQCRFRFLVIETSSEKAAAYADRELLGTARSVDACWKDYGDAEYSERRERRRRLALAYFVTGTARRLRTTGLLF